MIIDWKPFLFLVIANAIPFNAMAQAPRSVDLVILAGQSNAVGFDSDPAELPPDPIDQKILFWFRCGDPPPDQHDSLGQSWQWLRPQPLGDPVKPRRNRQYGNFANHGGGFGPEITFARVTAKQSSQPLAVIKVAFSGTGIDKDWNSDETQAGACFQALCDELDVADEAAEKQGMRLRPAAFLWIQGESDANEVDAPLYQQRLEQLIAAVRRKVDAPKMPALIAVNTKFGLGKMPWMPKIVEAQIQCAAEDEHTTYVDTSDAPVVNSSHFSTQGTLLVGKLFADTFLSLASE